MTTKHKWQFQALSREAYEQTLAAAAAENARIDRDLENAVRKAHNGDYRFIVRVLREMSSKDGYHMTAGQLDMLGGLFWRQLPKKGPGRQPGTPVGAIERATEHIKREGRRIVKARRAAGHKVARRDQIEIAEGLIRRLIGAEQFAPEDVELIDAQHVLNALNRTGDRPRKQKRETR